MDKLERKFGKYAIKNLSLILIICYAVGYLFSMLPGLSSVLPFLTLDPSMIVKGQVWRLVTWIIIPPSSFSLGTLIMLFFYYSIGRSLEYAWGDFLYNLYIFSGLLFTILGSFGLYVFLLLTTHDAAIASANMGIACFYFSTYYVNMSIFLAYAATFPEARVLLMFIIPIKVKWLGVCYGAILLYEFITGGVVTKVVIFVSLLNFIVFFFLQRNHKYGSPRFRVKQAVRRREFKREVKSEARPNGISKHKCAICGKTELSHPDTEFRFCSKCNGNYEYCQDHLFTHKHIE